MIDCVGEASVPPVIVIWARDLRRLERVEGSDRCPRCKGLNFLPPPSLQATLAAGTGGKRTLELCQRPYCGHAEEQCADGQQNRCGNVCAERYVVAPLPHQSRVKAKGGKGCETAQKARGEEQAKLLTATAFDQKKLDEHAHKEAANDVHEQRAVGKVWPEVSERRMVYAVAKRCPNPAANENDEIAPRHTDTVAPSLNVGNGSEAVIASFNYCLGCPRLPCIGSPNS